MLHPLAGKLLVMQRLKMRHPGGDLPVLVVGHGEEAVRQAVGEAARLRQEKQLGTGTRDGG
jgi:bifunctional N-acetylglucosamine-1-phosphate-uridyltransferase/glucosamine-1-phosphate-acetyltransferase GlmU-like protein